MNVKAMSHLYDHFKDDQLTFVYRGDFTDSITDKIISLNEINIDSHPESSKIRNKVSFIIVESFQNVVRHNSTTDENGNESLSSSFLLRNIGDVFYISSCNKIVNKNAETLRGKLDHINGLSAEEKKKLYLEVLSNQGLSDKGGAGLGLIEMARKSGHPIDYSFQKLNNEYSFLHLLCVMNGKETIDKISIEKFIDTNRFVGEHNILMSYKGNYNRDSILPLIKMIRQNINAKIESSFIQKKMFHIVVELLQNISKHGVQTDNTTEGIFSIVYDKGLYYIFAGNYADSANATILEDSFNQLKQLSNEELNLLYKERLKDMDENKKSAGLGLIDISRESTNEVDYEIKKVQDNLFFYTISVKLN